jgi:hypothetical protein
MIDTYLWLQALKKLKTQSLHLKITMKKKYFNMKINYMSMIRSLIILKKVIRE